MQVLSSLIYCWISYLWISKMLEQKWLLHKRMLLLVFSPSAS